MNTKVYDTLVGALNDLKKEGYTHNFEIRKDCIFCLDDEKKFMPADFTVEETFRFEGMTNPADSSILYAAVTTGGTKGTFVENYSIDATTLTKEMREKLKYQIGEDMVRPEDL